jgi:hypothetical protein
MGPGVDPFIIEHWARSIARVTLPPTATNIRLTGSGLRSFVGPLHRDILTGGEAGPHTGHAGAMASWVVDAAAGGGQKGRVHY